MLLSKLPIPGNMGLAVGAHPKKILNEGDITDLVEKIRELHAAKKLYAIGEVGKYLPWKHSLATCFVNILGRGYP